MAQKLELGPLAPFDPKGNATQWKRWKRSFEFFAVGKGVEKDSQKTALLLHCAGPEVQDIFETIRTDPGPIPDEGDTEYAKAIRKLDAQFLPKVNTPYERHVFRQARQEENETVDQFVTRLYHLAETCSFEEKKKEYIRDQVIDKCKSSILRRKVLERKEMTLENLQDLARAMEAAEKQSKLMENDFKAVVVNSITTNKKPAKGKAPGKACFRCGKEGHLSKDKECPAHSATCRKYQLVGHYANVCKTKNPKNKQENNKERSSKKSGHDSVREVTSDYAFGVSSEGTETPKIDIEVGGVLIKGIIIDSGATCNVIDRNTWNFLKENGIKCDSKKTNRKLYSYGSTTPLQVAGEFKANIRLKDNIVSTDFIVIEKNATSILGRQTSEDLGVLKLETHVNSVTVGELSFLHEYKKDFKCKLHVDPSVKPVAQKARPVPFNLREKVDQKIKELIDNDIIETVEGPTPWVSPVVIVPKPSGDIRLCVDMRRANEAIIRERHPIPTVEEILYNLNGSTIFSKLDLKWGFHQIELEEESRVITTFANHNGLFRYKRLMFGISSAPEMYQHILQQVLIDCEGAHNIADDIIVHANTVEEHDKRLKAVMERLHEKNLTLNEGKCQFRMSELSFMGHLFSAKGIGPTESRVEAVANAREPQNAAETRSFLGLVNFSAKFLPNLATTAEPLRRLTRKGVLFEWGPEQKESFAELKNKLEDAETLAYFDRDAEIQLVTDASPVGLGAVLLQVKDGIKRVVAYASRSLSDVERRYSQTEKEALGLVWGCERFHMYLYNTEFTLFTDHKPLVIYSSKSRPCARIERWVLRLQSYKFKVKYIPGAQNIADSLSRLSTRGQDTGGQFNIAEEYIRYVAENAAPVAVSIQEIERESADDSELCGVRDCINKEDWDNLPKQYKAVRYELSTLGKLVLRGTRLVIPGKLRNQIIELAHEGHQGVVKTKQRARTKVWWPSIDKHVENKCKTCHGCQLVGLPTPPEPMKRSQFPTQPWKDLATDLLGPLPSGDYLFVIVDYYSRFFEVDIMKSVISTKIIESLEKIFCTHGLPHSLKTDNGPQFISGEFASFLQKNNIQHRSSTPIWPQANGEIERQNRTLLKILKIAQVEKKDWRSELRKLLTAYRTTPHSTTGVSPAKLLFGREIRSKIPELIQTQLEDSEVRDRDAEFKQKQKDYADAKRGATFENGLKTGDVVLLKQKKENKLSTTFEDVPYKVTDKEGSELTLQHPTGVTYRRNVTHVKKYCSNTEDSTNTESEDSTSVEPTLPDVSLRPVRERRAPSYLKDYEVS